MKTVPQPGDSESPRHETSASAEPPSRWPHIDIWLVAVVLVAVAIFALLTFEMWVPHPFSH
jgi:hypothetical protein